MNCYLGIAIGGTKCIVSLGRETDGELTILDSRRIPTADTPSPLETLGRLADLGEELMKLHDTEISAVGIACGSPLDSKRGVIQCPPNLPGWVDVPAAEFFSKRFGVPAYLENDANAGALAEWRFGAAKGSENAVFLTFGTGFGAGLIINGRLYAGTHGMAGEIGHVRLSERGPVGYGKEGSVEGFCSGGGIARLARGLCLEKLRQGEKPSLCPTEEALGSLSAASVAAAAKEGDALAKRIFELSGEMLGRTLAMIIDTLDPQVIVIGSIFARAEELLRPAMERAIKAEALPSLAADCRVVPAMLGDRVDEYEALTIASYNCGIFSGGKK